MNGISVHSTVARQRPDETTGVAGGYRVYRHEINERAKKLKLWIRRKRGNRKWLCSGCGRKLEAAHDISEREVRDLPCLEFRTTVGPSYIQTIRDIGYRFEAG